RLTNKGESTMKNLCIALLVILALSVSVLAETWKNVPLVDSMCAAKVKENPDKHPTKCAIKCADGGYGIIAGDGKFLKFDEDGNAKALAALKATKKENSLRATVTGDLSGDTIKVKSVSLD